MVPEAGRAEEAQARGGPEAGASGRLHGRGRPERRRLPIEEKFAGKTLVTASLKAPSVVVLKLVADIDPATPVVFIYPRVSVTLRPIV